MLKRRSRAGTSTCMGGGGGEGGGGVMMVSGSRKRLKQGTRAQLALSSIRLQL
jgi:hypothetical protein